MNKQYLFIDTESSFHENERVIYDLSFSIVEHNKSNIKFEKTLRNRYIKYSGDILSIIAEKNIIIEEFSHLIPSYRKTNYGFANYCTMSFKNAVSVLKLTCDTYKPDAIIGYNFQSDIQTIKNTQSILKSSDIIYMNNSRLPSYKLFKSKKCISFDNAFKNDMLLYLLRNYD